MERARSARHKFLEQYDNLREYTNEAMSEVEMAMLLLMHESLPEAVAEYCTLLVADAYSTGKL